MMRVVDVQVPIRRKWWQFWRPKIVGYWTKPVLEVSPTERISLVASLNEFWGREMYR